MLPVFLLGVAAFLGILLLTQSFRLTEYVIIHGAKLSAILHIFAYLGISFLPIIFPMSTLFSILMTYGRLSNDSEIVAFKSLGLNMFHLSVPAFLLACLATILALQTSFFIGPWGNRQMEILIHRIAESKPSLSLKQGVFSEGYFDLVVYANKIKSKDGLLEQIFIFDERQAEPTTIIADQGKLINDDKMHGQKAYLKLFNGSIHKNNESFYTKIDFESYDFALFDPINFTKKSKSPLSYSMTELIEAQDNSKLTKKFRHVLYVEFHKRWAIGIACLIFAFLAVTLGTRANHRSGRSNGFVTSILIVILYWITHAVFESLGKSAVLPVEVALWTPNVIFLGAGVYLFKRDHKT